MAALMQLDLNIRRIVYAALRRGEPMPTAASLAKVTQTHADEVAGSLKRLADAHMLVLQENGEVLMANPFSAVPTPFVTTIGAHSWYGNCIWDAMGIAAALGAEARIETACGCCGTAMALRVPDECIVDERVVHFAIPAAHWWDNIVFN